MDRHLKVPAQIPHGVTDPASKDRRVLGETARKVLEMDLVTLGVSVRRKLRTLPILLLEGMVPRPSLVGLRPRLDFVLPEIATWTPLALALHEDGQGLGNTRARR